MRRSNLEAHCQVRRKGERGPSWLPEERLAAASARPSHKYGTFLLRRCWPFHQSVFNRRWKRKDMDMHHLRQYAGTGSSKTRFCCREECSRYDTSSRLKRAVRKREIADGQIRSWLQVSRRMERYVQESYRMAVMTRKSYWFCYHSHPILKLVIDSVIDAGTFYLIRDEIAPYVCQILIK